jgi:Ca-activated chloride channel family protein
MKRALILVLIVLAVAPRAGWGDAGVLIPTNLRQPDPKYLSLDEMAIDIRIDNGDARVSIRQIFASHHPGVLEATYYFALPGRAAVSDFAVWDGLTRIPGVILERKRAEEIYQDLRWQHIDPGLLQVGEGEAAEARRTTVFSARIVPIPAFGTKRIEIEYRETIPVEDLKSLFVFPLKPDAYRGLAAGRLSIDFELRSAHALRDFEVASKTYPLTINEQTANLVRGSFQASNVTFTEDFAVRYSLDSARADQMEVITYRNPAPAPPSPTETAAPQVVNEPGFFQASGLIAAPAAAGAGAGARTVVVLFDNSLSMQWEKLERSFQALESLLGSLRPADEFSLVLFNSEVAPFAPAPAAASPASVDKALEFVRGSLLRGGTDLQRALQAGLAQAAAGKGEPYLVLLGDGDPTRGTINNGKLAAWYAAAWKKVGQARRPRNYMFAVGDDANVSLLRMLARNDGVMEWVRSTEPLEFKLDSFLAKIGRRPVEGLQFSATPAANFDLVYALQDTSFAGSLASWVGQYKRALPQAAFEARGMREGRPLLMQATAALPAQNLDHPQLPRTWAQLRVNALLEKIEREGEDRASVDEIVRLARKYKFVTPYTSFLAAPRSLLRPRVIRPGDPVLRVRTDPSIVSVVALFPFGLIKPLRYLGGEDIWQTRFLAPTDMNDGTYWVRLVLRDKAGRVYRERKSFVIASRPPTVRVKLDRTSFRRGETVALRVNASESTRTIIARMPGVAPVRLTWNPKAGANTGEFILPAYLPAGRYVLTVTAEDIAHNIGSQEVPLEVLP